MTEENIDREFGWDDEIKNDGPPSLLPPGEYAFTVKSFERGRHNGSTNLPSCNMAILMVKVGGDVGGTTIKHRLFLHSKTEGFLCQFFKSIGARKHGERLRMDWNTVPGATGRCKIGTRKFADKEYNEIKSFIEPKDAPQAASAGFTPGAF